MAVTRKRQPSTKGADRVKEGRVLYKLFSPEVKALDEDGAIQTVMSAQNPDRDGDIIHQDGWDLASFLKHPVLLVDHNYRDIVAQIGEWSDVHAEGKGARAKLIGTAHYYVGEGNEKADWAYNLAKKGRAAFSVGFIPLKYEIIESEDFDGWFPPVEFFEQSMLETSAVTVPAHQDALQLMISDKSYDPVLRKMARGVLDDEDLSSMLKGHRKGNSFCKCILDGCEEEAISDGLPICMAHVGKLSAILVAGTDFIETKSGRTLSKANEDKLSQAQRLIDEVLNQVKAQSPDDEEEDDEEDPGDTTDSKEAVVPVVRAAGDDDDEDDKPGSGEDDNDEDDKPSKDYATCCESMECCQEGECSETCSEEDSCCAGGKGETEDDDDESKTVEEDGNTHAEPMELTISQDLIADIIRSGVPIADEEEE